MNYCNQQCELEPWHTYILYYWQMPLNKYACHMAHICPTTLTMCSTYRPHITAHTSPKLKQQIAASH